MKEIIVATNNPGKVAEITKILKEVPDIRLLTMEEAGIELDVEETKDTFEKNALKKAAEIAGISGKTCIADDSGLCIDALNGMPGVKTKRFLGEKATDEDRNDYYLEKLRDMPKEKRTLTVVTAIVIATPNGESATFIGEMKGFLAMYPRGSNGFAFDTVVETKEGKTLAELSVEEKNAISSRRKALEKLGSYMLK